jgi:hypothetical protein
LSPANLQLCAEQMLVYRAKMSLLWQVDVLHAILAVVGATLQDPPTCLLQAQKHVGKREFRATSVTWPPQVPVGHMVTVGGKLEKQGWSPDGTLVSEAVFSAVSGLKFHPVTRELMFSDMLNGVIRKINAEGRLVSVIGQMSECNSLHIPIGWSDQCNDPRDGGLAKYAHLNLSHDFIFDEAGGMYIADSGNHMVRYVEPESGNIVKIAGQAGRTGNGGDGGQATESLLWYPHDVALDPMTQDLFIADFGNGAVRKIDGQTGVISTWYKHSNNASHPVRIVFVPQQGGSRDLYIVDQGLGQVYRVDVETREMTVLAGNIATPPMVDTGDGGSVLEANLCTPSGMDLDDVTGDLFLSSFLCHTVRHVSRATGIISTLAGTTGVQAASTHVRGDGRPGLETLLNEPISIAWDSELRQLWVAEGRGSDLRMLQL